MIAMKETNLKLVSKLLFIAVLLILLAVLVGQVWHRPIDRDEGFWMYTSWRVSLGDTMYRDFALPHTPLGVLYYSLIAGISGVSLYIPRFINSLLVIIGAGAVFIGIRSGGGRIPAHVWLLLFLGSSLTLTWLVPVKSYAPTVFLISLSIAIWLLPAKTPRAIWLKAMGAGALLGFAVTARLTAAALIPGLIAAAVIETDGDVMDRITSGFAALLGVLFCIPLIFVYWSIAGDAFLFNVWGIHKLFVGQGGWMGRFYSLLDILKHPDFILLFIVAGFALISPEKRKLSYPLIAGALVVIVHFIPGSTQAQYFVLAVVPLAIAGAFGLAEIYRRWRFIGVALLVLLIALGAARPAGKILFDRAHKESVGPVAVYEASELLKLNSEEDDIIFCAWPGYAALAERRLVPGWELGYFTDRIGVRVDEATRRKRCLMTYEETAFWLERGVAEIVVDGIDTPDELLPVIEEYYTIIEESKDIRIYRFDEATLPEGEGRAFVELP